MLRRFGGNIRSYFRTNLGFYVLVLSLFVVGIICGSLAVNTLNGEQKGELIDYLQGFFQGLEKEQAVSNAMVVKQAFFSNLKTVLAIWVLGLTVIGAPAILFIVFTRGFVLGFTVGFLVDEYIFKGILFAIGSILPQNLLLIPAIVIASVAALSFAWLVVKAKLMKKQIYLYQEFVAYTMLTGIMVGIVVVAVLIQGYITPVFMKLITSFLFTG